MANAASDSLGTGALIKVCLLFNRGLDLTHEQRMTRSRVGCKIRPW